MARKSKNEDTKTQISKKGIAKGRVTRVRTSKQNTVGDEKATAKSDFRVILKDINKPDVIDKIPEDIQLNKLRKRNNKFQEHQVQKVAKIDNLSVCSSSTSSQDLISTNDNNGQEPTSINQQLLQSDSKQSQVVCGKTSECKSPDISSNKIDLPSGPKKPNINKLSQRMAQLKEAKDKKIVLSEKKKQPLRKKQPNKKPSNTELSVEKVISTGNEDLKKKGKEKCPVKQILRQEKTSFLSQEDVSDSEVSDDEGADTDMEWEDVAEAELGILNRNNDEGEGSANLPSSSGNVEVTISMPGKKKSAKCPKEVFRKWFERKINRIRKESQISSHKVHLLSLLAIGLKKNELCNNLVLQAVGFSLLPGSFTQRNLLKTWDISFLMRVATWFKNIAPLPGEIHTGNSEATYLMRVLEKKVYLFVVILRALGLSTRLVMSLQTLNIKINDEGKNIGQLKRSKTPNSKQIGKQNQNLKKETKNSSKEKLLNKIKGKLSPKVGESCTGKTPRKKSRNDHSMNNERKESEYFKGKNKSLGDSSSANISNYSDEDFDVSSYKTPKRHRTSLKGLSGGHSVPGEVAVEIGESSSTPKRGVDMWVEVYVEKEKKWICIDSEVYSVKQPEECEKRATKPIKYVMAFDNENCIKDVTARYASGWLTSTPKLRVEPEWWTKTLDLYKTTNLKKDKKEDALIKAFLHRKPLPTTLSEYKNHPLYALQRHLLKFEAIYPECAATLGFCRGEAVYSRDCVHSLHTRDIWLKEAKVVKTGEKCYKIVKGKKSKRKMLENVGEITAELFGRWQTEDYVPPPVIDGKIPRNEYGNVELFKPSMLPLGTCHIQVPGILRLARKLNIDAVAAVVGFEFHCGFSHPVIDGVVVCEENKDTLLEAWEKEQEQKIKREQEKREKRVVDNWTHIVRSLRIRERLKRKYNMEDDENIKQEKEKVQNSKETEDVMDVSLSWPLNRQEGKSTRADNGHCHVFLETNHRQDDVTGEWSKTCSCGFKEPLLKT